MLTRQTLSVAFRCAPLRMFLALSVAAGFVVPFFAGCGGDRGPHRVVVSGAVTYNGKPLPNGAILFVPVETAHAPMAGVAIVNGNFKADALGGVPVGKHKIQIEAYRNDKSVASRFPEVGARIQYLPAKYNVNTQLEIAIPPGSPAITKNFELTD